MQHAADPAIERNLAAANRVDRYAGGIREIFDGKLKINFHRHIAKETTFYANERNLVVELPWHIIARADMDVFVCKTIADHGLNCLRLGSFLRGEAGAIQHIQKIGVAAGV